MNSVKNLFLLSLVILSNSIYGQDSLIVQFDKTLNNLQDDTVKVNTLLSVSEKLYPTKPKDAIRYSKLAKELAQKLNYHEGEAYALKYIGLSNYYLGEYLQVIISWEEALSIFESIDDKNGIANIRGSNSTGIR